MVSLRHVGLFEGFRLKYKCWTVFNEWFMLCWKAWNAFSFDRKLRFHLILLSGKIFSPLQNWPYTANRWCSMIQTETNCAGRWVASFRKMAHAYRKCFIVSPDSIVCPLDCKTAKTVSWIKVSPLSKTFIIQYKKSYVLPTFPWKMDQFFVFLDF